MCGIIPATVLLLNRLGNLSQILSKEGVVPGKDPAGPSYHYRLSINGMKQRRKAISP